MFTLTRFLVCFSVLQVVSAFAFDPPNAAERAAAIGSVEGESPVFQKLLAADGDFSPIHVPQFGDWLNYHLEPGQSFDRYTHTRFNHPDAAHRTIYLLPIGEFSQDNSPELDDLKAYAEAYFQLDVKVLAPVTVEQGKFTTRINEFTHKSQILTATALAFLKTQLPQDAFCLLGVTMEDLYPGDDWNFVFGIASLNERIGIYSFARYDPAFLGQPRTSDYRQLILRRSCKVLAHETGHMFGIPHCIHFECLMNGSNNLGETDASPQHLCPVCLRKLHFNIQFDPVTRYRELSRFYHSHGWTEEEDWVEHQLAKAAAP